MKYSLLYKGLLLTSIFLSFGTTGEAQAQNVGINTTSPTQTLDVNGQLRVRGLSGSGSRLPMIGSDGTLEASAPVYTNAPTSEAFSQTASLQIVGGPVDVAVRGTAAT